MITRRPVQICLSEDELRKLEKLRKYNGFRSWGETVRTLIENKIK